MQTWYPIQLTPSAHSNDVKAVSVSANGTLVATASRDGSVQLWNRNNETGTLTSSESLHLHEGFVNSVAFASNDSICSGGSDNLISVWNRASKSPEALLVAHEGNVCKLVSLPASCGPFVLASASWDGSARLWTEEWNPATSLLLKDVSASGPCWTVTALGPETFVTGHGDCGLRWWRGERMFRCTKSAHSDVIRDAVALGKGKFVITCGNDGAVRIWDAESGKPVVQEEAAHPAFIYSICAVEMGSEALIATCGEEGWCKIWRFSLETQVLTFESELRIPALSVWTAAFTAEADLIVGGSGGLMAVFTSNKANRNPQIEAEFTQALHLFQLASTKQAELEKSAQSASVLAAPGSRIGQNVVVDVGGGKFAAHQWTGTEWIELGQVVSNAPPGKPRASHDGLEYDFVFKVELDDEGTSYELPYNRGQNPYGVAQEFLNRNDLPISYLDQVAQFIFKSAGAEATRPLEEEKESKKAKSDSFVSFSIYNEGGILGKLKEFGMEQPSLEASQKALNDWPVCQLFPLIDWLRVQVLISKGQKVAKIPFDKICSGLKATSSKAEMAALTMSLRFYCNLCSVSSAVDSGELVEIVGSSTAVIKFNSSTWIPLLLALLNNMALNETFKDEEDALLALLIGVLEEAKGAGNLTADDWKCIKTVMKKSSSASEALKVAINSILQEYPNN